MISIVYNPDISRKSAASKRQTLNKPRKRIIHTATLWRKMLDDGTVKSLSQIAENEGLTRARVTQIMNLLKLSAEMREFLLGLDDPKEISKYSERRLRSNKTLIPVKKALTEKRKAIIFLNRNIIRESK